MLNLAGADQRQDDLFMNENIFSRGKSALKGLKVSHIRYSEAYSVSHNVTYRVSRMYIRNIPHMFRKRWTCF
jgi:hypothetical protein